MLIRLDLFVLEKVEKFSHWWQRMFGQDCFWWAKSLTTVSVIMAFSGAFAFLLTEAESDFITDILVSSFAATMSFIWFPFISFVEKQAKIAYENSLGNPEKLCSRERIFFLLLLCVMMLPIMIRVHLLLGLGYMFYIPINYFCACDPLPPAKSKVRQWLKSAVSATKKVFSSTPQPVLVPVPSR